MKIKSLFVIATTFMFLSNAVHCQGLLGGLKKGLNNLKESIDKTLNVEGQEKTADPNNQQIDTDNVDGKNKPAEAQKIEAEMKEYSKSIAKMDDTQLMKELDEMITALRTNTLEDFKDLFWFYLRPEDRLRKIGYKDADNPLIQRYEAKIYYLLLEATNNRSIIYARLIAIAMIPEMASTADFLKEQRSKAIETLMAEDSIDTTRIVPDNVEKYGFQFQAETLRVLATGSEPIAKEIVRIQLEMEKERHGRYEKGKDDPAFIFPRRDICNSEIELYKNFKSGTNREIINGGPLERINAVTIETSDGYYATSISSGQKKSQDKSVTKVTFTFAQKGKKDDIAVLVSVKVDIYSASITFKDLLKKYTMKMQIEKPNISDTIKARKVMFPHDEGSNLLDAIEEHVSECVLNKDGLEVRIKGSYIKPVIKETKISVTDDGTKCTLSEEEKHTIQSIVKEFTDSKPHSIIQITDLNQVNAYKQFFDSEEKAHEEAEKKQKEAEEKAHEEAEKKQKEAVKEELLDF